MHKFTKQTRCKGSAEMLERIAYSASQIFGGFSADENSAANTAKANTLCPKKGSYQTLGSNFVKS